MLIEFGEVAYSVVEGDRFYNITVVKQGEPGEDIAVSIFPSEDTTAVDTVECKRITVYSRATAVTYIFVVTNYSSF